MNSSIIAPESLLRTIANLQTELASLQSALGVEGISFAPAKGAKTKKVKDPNAEPKEPNVWIKFTQRVGALIKESHPDNKAPATIGKQFCSYLKEQKPYDQWEDSEILEAFNSWTPPDQSKMEITGKTKKTESTSASESGSVTSERKKRAPLSDEAKAARREKMEKKKASDSTDEEKPAKTVFKPKAVTKPSYTMEQLTDLDGFDFEGNSYGRNVRGDVVSYDGSYYGHWDGKTVVKGNPPADWASIESAM